MTTRMISITLLIQLNSVVKYKVGNHCFVSFLHQQLIDLSSVVGVVIEDMNQDLLNAVFKTFSLSVGVFNDILQNQIIEDFLGGLMVQFGHAHDIVECLGLKNTSCIFFFQDSIDPNGVRVDHVTH